MKQKKLYGFLQSLTIVTPDDNSDLEIFGQYYKIPSSGVSPEIEMCGSTYKYDFRTREVILLSNEGKEIIRKKIDPKLIAKSEYKWIKLIKEEARLQLGLDECY